MSDKLTISWDDLSAPAVEETLREREAVGRTKAHFETANVPAAARRGVGKSKWWTRAPIYLTLFGLLGGALGWAAGLPFHLRPNAEAEARVLIQQFDSIAPAVAAGKMSATEAAAARAEVARSAGTNPYYQAHVDPSLNERQRERATLDALEIDRWRDLIADLLFYGMAGLFVAAALSSADRLIERDWSGAAVNGLVGATLGLIGGLLVALVVGRLFAVAVGGVDSAYTAARETAARAVSFGVLGLFLAAAPGVVMGSAKRMVIGMLGGLVGGLIGGLAFDPLSAATNAEVGRLVCVASIGALAGLASALVENALKTGWLKVASGVIAGKQFVLYRDPTFIGSAPMSHIYLWKDAAVGRRHAAIHHTAAGGFEVENLPPGGPTLVNGRPVHHSRLKPGDQVSVGRTTFVFQEREKRK